MSLRARSTPGTPQVHPTCPEPWQGRVCLPFQPGSLTFSLPRLWKSACAPSATAWPLCTLATGARRDLICHSLQAYGEKYKQQAPCLALFVSQPSKGLTKALLGSVSGASSLPSLAEPCSAAAKGRPCSRRPHKVGGPIKLLGGAAGLPPEVRHAPGSDDPKEATPDFGNEGENQSKIRRDPSPAPKIPGPITVQDTKEFSVTWE